MTIEFDSEATERMFKSLGDGVGQAVSKGVTAAAIVVQNEAVRLIRDTPKTGRTYTHFVRMIGGNPVELTGTPKMKRDKPHKASAKGEPPATDTGTLWTSISVISRGLEADVFTNVNYAAFLEFGTSRMGKRPFLSPALRNKRKEVIKRIRDSIRDAIKRVT